MNIAEILRKLADIIDSKESGDQSTEITNRPEIAGVEVSAPTDTQGIEGDAQVNTRSMVSPLQQKLELMKKMAGEETCDTCHSSPCACDDGAEDEMAIMKRNAGIAPTIVAMADEDEPFEG
jgi:hypothetical protein